MRPNEQITINFVAFIYFKKDKREKGRDGTI